ncbi:hypothetical protein PROPEN_04673 [Proteus penneri ATCC 35198]|nr:hypothetical protein PROPEN_04673 [Proteus penneri ATCC 35198]
MLAIIDPKKAQNDVTESQETNNELRANLQQAQAELRLAQLTYQRQLKLIGTHAIAQDELDRTKTDVEVKKARIITYQAQIKKEPSYVRYSKNESAIYTYHCAYGWHSDVY